MANSLFSFYNDIKKSTSLGRKMTIDTIYVIYNPEIELLERSIKSIVSQVRKIYIVAIANTFGYQYSTDSGYILSFISMGILVFLMSVYMTYIVFKGYSYFIHFKNGFLSLFFKAIIFFLIIGIILKGPIFFSDKFMPVLIFVFMVQHYLKGISKIEKFNTNSNL